MASTEPEVQGCTPIPDQEVLLACDALLFHPECPRFDDAAGLMTAMRAALEVFVQNRANHAGDLP